MINYEGRHLNLKNRINTHLSILCKKGPDFYSALTQNELVELKSVLSDINNVLTFKTTITAAKWICSYFDLDEKTAEKVLAEVDNAKPNTKGFDIHITEPYKIIAEVKCISPVNNGGKFGAAQWNSILDDFHKLKNSKNSISDTSQYYKFVFLLDLGERTDQAISHLLKITKGTSDIPLRANRHHIKEHILPLNTIAKFEDLSFDKVYLKTIQLDN